MLRIYIFCIHIQIVYERACTRAKYSYNPSHQPKSLFKHISN